MNLSSRIDKLIKFINQGLFEKEEIIKIALLSVLAGQNIFLYGPPGTAKSMISRRISMIFKDSHYFEHLMHRFCTPEELFGPVSLSELKKDNYKRLTEGFLAEADFAFLDEIWKSSPAVLNTLLTLINEHKYHNGSVIMSTPLKSLISASNEIPSEQDSLQALYDRFLTRLEVNPISSDVIFEKMLESAGSFTQPDISTVTSFLITTQEYSNWLIEIDKVVLGKDCIKAIKDIRRTIYNYLNSKEGEWNSKEHDGIEKLSYISDRRWLQAVKLVKACAFYNDRTTADISDLAILKHSLWSTLEDKPSFEILLNKAIETNINSYNFASIGSIATNMLKNCKDSVENIKKGSYIPKLVNGEIMVSLFRNTQDYTFKEGQFRNLNKPDIEIGPDDAF